MAKCRMMFRSRLKAKCVDEYVRLHRKVPPRLIDAYRKAGITEISCFLNGLDLLVYSVCDTDVYAAMRKALSRNPVEIRWQKTMAKLRDPAFKSVEYTEVFNVCGSKRPRAGKRREEK